MKKARNEDLFQESYVLWLESKGLEHTPLNLGEFCELWNQNILLGIQKSIKELHEKLQK